MTALKRWYLGRQVEKPCSVVTQQMIEQYLLGRLEIRNPATVKRERTTITHFYRWVASRNDVPTFDNPAVGLPIFKSSADRALFRTVTGSRRTTKSPDSPYRSVITSASVKRWKRSSMSSRSSIITT